MNLNLLSFTLSGFYLGSTLLGRSFGGFWGNVDGYNHPIAVSIAPKILTITVRSKSNTVVIDQ